MRILRTRRLSLTLIEIMVAIGLLGVLTTFLLSYYRSLTIQQSEALQQREKSFGRRRAHGRLLEILTTAHPDSIYTSVASGRFAQGQNLTFLYENDADLSPELSGRVIGRLYFQPDKDGRASGSLCLATWPAELSDQQDAPDLPMRKEVLLDNLSAVRFGVYVPKEQDDITSTVYSSQSLEEARERSVGFVILAVEEPEEDFVREYTIPVAKGLSAVPVQE